MADPVIRYVHPGLNECTDPQATDWLHIVDVSATAGDEDRKVAVGNFALGGGADWTPQLAFGGNTLDITYGTRQGRWRRAGKLVVAQFYIVLTSKGANVGSASIINWPVSPMLGYSFTMTCQYANLATAIVTAYGLLANDICYLYGAAAAAVTSPLLSNTSFANNSALSGSVAYFAA